MKAILAEDIPDLYSVVPRPTREQTSVWSEAQATDYGLVTTEDVYQLSSPQAPNVDVEWFLTASSDDVTLCFYGEASELSLLVGLHSPKVLVFDQVESSHCSVFGASYHRIRLLGKELDV